MALVNRDSALGDVEKYLRECVVGAGIEIMSYKRNRTVGVVRRGIDTFTVVENGYHKQEFEATLATLLKKMKKIISREFPRSRKLRLFKFADEKQLQRIHQKI